MGNEKLLTFPYQKIFLFCSDYDHEPLLRAGTLLVSDHVPASSRQNQSCPGAKERHNLSDTPLWTLHAGKILSWADEQGPARNFKHKLEQTKGKGCCGSLRRVRTKKHILKLRAEKTFYSIRFFIPYHITTEFMAHCMKAPNTSLCQRQIFGLRKSLLQNNLAIFTLPYFG